MCAGQNRSHILFYVNLFLAVVKRCSWPDDPDRAARGGFVVAHTETGNPVCRNPAAPHIVPLVPHFLALLKVFNGLWTPDALASLSDVSLCRVPFAYHRFLNFSKEVRFFFFLSELKSLLRKV